MAESTKNTNSAVVDTSAIISQLLPDETFPRHISDIFKRFEQNTLTLFAPRLLTYEVANVLRTSVIRHRISSATSKKILATFLQFPIIYSDVDFEKTLTIAITHSLTIYDAAYVELAHSLNVPLISLDKNLAVFGN